MRALAWVLICAAALAPSCSDGDTGGGQCTHPPVGDGTAGSCRPARALLTCPIGDGLGCGCVTNLQSCPECPTIPRLSCRNVCGSHEYAVECGEPLDDSGPVVVFDPPPRGCQLAAQSAGTRAAYCCPCDE
jgi:hypothetical protein